MSEPFIGEIRIFDVMHFRRYGDWHMESRLKITLYIRYRCATTLSSEGIAIV